MIELHIGPNHMLGAGLDHGRFGCVMRYLRKLLVPVLFLVVHLHAYGQVLEVSSPNGVIRLTFSLESGAPFYHVTRAGTPIIAASRLGFRLLNAPDMLDHFAIESSAESQFDETWMQPWGERTIIRNHYRELRIDLKELSGVDRRMTLVFRVFNDGIGFRYEMSEQSSFAQFGILEEVTEFALEGDYLAWWIPAHHEQRYENLYKQSRVSTLDTVHTPLTLETDEGIFLSIHEAALTDYASMTLARSGDHILKADLVPWSDGVKVRSSLPMMTPWRTIQIADSPGGLITSYMILNLNEPNVLGDVSWVKPGKYVGVWWEMHLGRSTWGSGPNHGATTSNAKRYIDFAAKYGFDGVLVEGWNVGWDGNWIENGDLFQFTTPYDDFDIQEVTRYAAEKSVSLIGHHETGVGIINYERQMGEAFDYYQQLGVRTVKTGYVGFGQGIKRLDFDGRTQFEWHHGQYMVRHYRRTVEEAGRRRIMLDVHEPIKDTGIRRTFPNMMTREGARGQEYNAWSGDGGNPPEHTTILPFTRLLAGPMDFTPGIFDLTLEPARPNNRVNTTLAKQLALYVILYSPLQMAADLPENYETNMRAFRFIRDVPVDWEDTKVIHGSIGNYVTIVRKDRHSEDWYLGSITDEKERTLEAQLDFLEVGTTYVAEIYRDGPGADWASKPYLLATEKKLVDYGDVIELRLAPGGGYAVRFKPATEEDRYLFSSVGSEPRVSSYPNPTTKSVTVVYALPGTSDIKLEVYDVLGRKLVLLTSGVHDAGIYEFQWDVTHLSSGLYFYRLEIGASSVTKSFLVGR
ncbi:MAG: glycoside hydrolase family 97 catalytic domain-containing protein [Bacteroidetes bacterium]|nr:glycoside hydrolase family 97 catalytic domain-containing protein [Bacteroidota bacterium]